jgi:cytochrome c oxidase subunit II
MSFLRTCGLVIGLAPSHNPVAQVSNLLLRGVPTRYRSGGSAQVRTRKTLARCATGDATGFKRALRNWPVLSLLSLMFLLAGCGGDHPQSALHPASPEAATLARLWWFLFAVCTAVFLGVMGLLAAGLLRPENRKAEPPGGNMGFVVIPGVFITGIILVVILIYSLVVTVGLRGPEERLTIRVVGHQWWWEVEYPEHGIVIANELYIPVGERVKLELLAGDVIHSFWVPNLHGKRDLFPEHVNIFSIRAERPGIFRGQCAEFCGLQHALMGFYVVALPLEEFEQWIADRRRPHPAPDTPELQFGQRVFFEHGCNNCHAIRGTDAVADIGPDLTHMGSRLSIGAATLTNNYGALSGWIANPQPLKPGNLMPATYLAPDELHALVTYLQSLK